jgi:hypothetical protein
MGLTSQPAWRQKEFSVFEIKRLKL